ncbi:unnamed protein product [Brachionus calyciflorus]|uniref:Reverse transcriptase RNase H-like domain-containing protein n=1 Tax=Brachionus calyciflorus TaxID=104777 RepID=A0A814I2U3_9BILA|nr:unnamed protein product [Brachionus calyciflorus]
MEHFRVYLYVLVCTDHQPLKWMMNVKDPKRRVARWIVRLSEYSFRIEFRPGKLNGNANSLSRWLIKNDEKVHEKNLDADFNLIIFTDCQIVNENQYEWDLLLNKLGFVYCTAIHRATGYTSFEMVYGRQLKIPIDMFYENSSDPLEFDWARYVKQIKDRLKQIFETVRKDSDIKVEQTKFFTTEMLEVLILA